MKQATYTKRRALQVLPNSSVQLPVLKMTTPKQSSSSAQQTYGGKSSSRPFSREEENIWPFKRGMPPGPLLRRRRLQTEMEIEEIPSQAVSEEVISISQLPSQSHIPDSQRVEEFESERLSGLRSQDESSGSSESEPKSLLESFKRSLTKYDRSVRLFGHDYRNGKYEDAVSLDLFIREVIKRHDKDNAVRALVYDLNEEKYRLVLFKSHCSRELVQGVCLKLYMPWQEVSISEHCSMIIGASFYKILRSVDFKLSKNRIANLKVMAMPSWPVARVSDALFMDLVPYHIKNTKTIQKEIARFKSHIDVEIIVLNVWKPSVTCNSTSCLIKDSDEFVSFLEIPPKFVSVMSEVAPEKYFKLTSIAVHRKIKISENLAPFSVIQLFGSKQAFLYNLRFEDRSKCEAKARLDISMDYPREEHSLTTQQMHMASITLDFRTTLKCKLKEKGIRNILVHDLDSDTSTMIDFVLDSDIVLDLSALNLNEIIAIKFLRLIYGRAIWDKYTAYEELTDDDFEYSA